MPGLSTERRARATASGLHSERRTVHRAFPGTATFRFRYRCHPSCSSLTLAWIAPRQAHWLEEPLVTGIDAYPLSRSKNQMGEIPWTRDPGLGGRRRGQRRSVAMSRRRVSRGSMTSSMPKSSAARRAPSWERNRSIIS